MNTLVWNVLIVVIITRVAIAAVKAISEKQNFETNLMTNLNICSLPFLW